jgi:phospholipid-binding lipoprotein MlaA
MMICPAVLYASADADGHSYALDTILPVSDTTVAQNVPTGPASAAIAQQDKTVGSTPKQTIAPTKNDLDESDAETVADPVEPVNRLFFGFNDKLYFWVMKPFYSVYNAALPEEARIAGRNFFDNISMPVRFVSCLVQIRVQCAGVELARFGINTTIGMAGLFDIAAGEKFNLKPQDADMGLALGHYGVKEGFYLVIPVLGPSSLRDGVGTIADTFLTPTTYLTPFYVPYAVSAVNYINRGSLQGGNYEDMIKSAIDPYTAVKDAYTQYRRGKIK